MRLTVHHESIYRYDTPVRGVVQSHRLTPARFDGQRVEGWEVLVTGGQKGGGFRDGAGDWVQGWTIPGPVSEITVTVHGTIETSDLSGVLRGHRELVAPPVYLRETAPTAADIALVELAGTAQGADKLALAHALAGAVADAIAYRPGVTHAHTTAAEALALGEGVCQDHAHALIACARVRGLPGRYVSGYLHADGDGQAH
uniref:transglutaminase family protein n=1 Tax=Pararhodobacter sp. TaxID=2127056 RepID=UPI002FDD81FA